MKKRTKILLIAGIALLSIVVILCFTGVLGIQTLYLPVKVEITRIITEAGKSSQSNSEGSIEYDYGSNGYLKKIHFRGWPTGTLSATCNISGNVTALEDVYFIMLSDDMAGSLHLSYTYSIRS